MAKNEYVSMANIDAICFVLNCKISDVIEYIENGNEYYAGNLIYVRNSDEITMVNLVTGEHKSVNRQNIL